MLNIAIFISGRLLGYRDCLLPFINNLKKKYNIFLFFSINTFSLDNNNKNLEFVINDLKNTFGETIGEIYFEEYKFPKNYVENRIDNNVTTFTYNCLSCFYNDSKVNSQRLEKAYDSLKNCQDLGDNEQANYLEVCTLRNRFCY